MFIYSTGGQRGAVPAAAAPSEDRQEDFPPLPPSAAKMGKGKII